MLLDEGADLVGDSTYPGGLGAYFPGKCLVRVHLEINSGAF